MKIELDAEELRTIVAYLKSVMFPEQPQENYDLNKVLDVFCKLKDYSQKGGIYEHGASKKQLLEAIDMAFEDVTCL